MRWLLGIAAVLVFLAGVQLFVFPLDTGTRFAWTIASPMTAVFLGASYWSAVGLELSGARARRWTVARVAVPAVFVFTALTFVVTMVHLDKFHLAAELAAVTRGVTWAWIAVYAVVPLLMVVAWWVQSRAGTSVPPPAGLPPLLRGLLAVLAVVLLALGAALLIAPGWADAAWPWPLTPLTGRAIGAWNVGLGVAAGHAWLVDDAPSLVPGRRHRRALRGAADGRPAPPRRRAGLVEPGRRGLRRRPRRGDRRGRLAAPRGPARRRCPETGP